MSLTHDRLFRLWKVAAGLYWAAFGLIWLPVARELLGPSGFLPEPRYNFSQVHFPWMGWTWLTDPATALIPWSLIVGGLLLMSPWDRAGAALLWLISVIALNRNNMIESAEWPLWGVLLFAWALTGLRSPATSFLLWLSLALFSALTAVDQALSGWVFSPALGRLLENTYLTQSWALENVVPVLQGPIGSVLSTLIFALHLTTPLLILFFPTRRLVLFLWVILHLGSLALLGFPQIALGFLIWTLGLFLAHSPLACWYQLRERRRLALFVVATSFVVVARPFSLMSAAPTPGMSKTWALSPLQYPFGRPFASDGYQNRVTIKLIGPPDRTLQNDRELFEALSDNSRRRLFVFNSLSTFHRMNPGLIRQILQRSFCEGGLLREKLRIESRVQALRISRSHVSGSITSLEFPCP